MKRFRFGLTRLERLREVRRTRARGELARAVTEARRWRERADAATRALERPGPLDDAERPVDAAVARADAEWRAARRDARTDARRREREARGEIVQRQRAYADAAREHRVVERLREKRFERWRLDAERDERKFLDEVHLLRLLRERSAGHGRHEEEDG